MNPNDFSTLKSTPSESGVLQSIQVSKQKRGLQIIVFFLIVGVLLAGYYFLNNRPIHSVPEVAEEHTSTTPIEEKLKVTQAQLQMMFIGADTGVWGTQQIYVNADRSKAYLNTTDYSAVPSNEFGVPVEVELTLLPNIDAQTVEFFRLGSGEANSEMRIVRDKNNVYMFNGNSSTLELRPELDAATFRTIGSFAVSENASIAYFADKNHVYRINFGAEGLLVPIPDADPTTFDPYTLITFRAGN